MPVVVPVKFAFAARELWFDPQYLDILEGDHAVCSTERGTEIGLVVADPFEVEPEELAAPLKPVLRIATDADLDRADELADAGEDAMFDFRRLVEKNDLDMKPVGVEYLFGGEKAVFYFAAEDRVDFRQLVKDLSAHFHVRVDMRQIGVRDETRLQGGYATCGQELCCTRFGGQFEPVSIRMAKEQDLPLNSAKISGVCGRLMCCLRYEFEAYKDFKSRAPKKKTLIDTPLGKARIVEYNTPREQLVLRLESGKVFRVNLSDMSCTDENKERCEQQKCSCRPDCVTRDVLERLDSPDLQLALMELDRKNGVDVGDGLSTADRIVASGPTPRRKRMREEEAAKFEGSGSSRGGRSRKAAAQAEDDQPANAPRRRRRRSDAEAPAPQAEAASEQAPSRRRRHRSGASATAKPAESTARENAAAAPSSNDAAPGRSRRRRHTSSAQANEPQAPKSQPRARSHKPETPSVADQLAAGEVKVQRRRPGDGGGAQTRPHDGQSRAESGANDGEPKKRRRRSRRKPKQGGGESGAPSAE
ncbi:MAG: regulatory iron-sulfur-containing complex subunit RicT [Coriobacteriaceae bacterium]|nr:regulatory iron-sulfur-containing complex subunit RicT [Coriobacteriaceae bacterium]